MARRNHRERRLSVLMEVAQALNSATDVDSALHRTLALLDELLDLPISWVWLQDTGTHRFYLAASLHAPVWVREAARRAAEGGESQQTLGTLTDRPEQITVNKAAAESAGSGAQRHYARAPLLFHERRLGVLNVASGDWRRLTPIELEILMAVASQVGVAVERERLAEENARVVRLEERARLAREIHDVIAQGLTGAILHLDGARAYLDSDPARARVLLDSAVQTTRESLEEARRSVQNLRATPLEGKPLAEALMALGRSFSAETGLSIRTQAVTDRVLPPHIEIELYRIAGEALRNIQRHARATEASVRLRTVGDRTRLSIRDNGQGFNPEEIPAGRFGILGMKERARLVGGSLRLVSVPGRGSAVAAVVPLSAERPG